MVRRWRDLLPAGWVQDLRGRRSGPLVLLSALLVAVFMASLATGYTVSRPLHDNGGAVLAKGNTVAYVNGESGRAEAEARALVSGKQPLETVTLSDGRVAVVSNTAQRVWLFDPATMTPQRAPISRDGGAGGAGGTGGTGGTDEHLTVVAGPRHSYLIDARAETVEEIDPAGAPTTPVRVPGGATATAVPDAVDGVWVRTDDARVVQVRDGKVQRRVDSGGRVEHLTLADSRPIAITDSGELLDVAAHPLRRISGDPVPHGLNVVVGSPKGAGRWVLIVDRRAGELVVVDPRTGTRRVFSDLPQGPTSNLGAPVVVGDLVYIPDHAAHLLYVRNARTGESSPDIAVPGTSPLFSLEVHGEQVWANDQHDRRAVVIGPYGDPKTVDKGTGNELTDTTAETGSVAALGPPNPEPVRAAAEPGRLPVPPGAAPPVPAALDPEPEPGSRRGPAAPEQVRVPDIRPGTSKDDACQRIEDAGLLCGALATSSAGPAEEVIGTDPPGGATVPRGYRVTVRHYGPTAVPDVVGRFSTDACQEIKALQLHCASQPNPDVAGTPDQLDVVSAQDPAPGARTSARSAVTVRYWNRAVLGDYRNRPGAQACAEIKESYRRVECTVTEGETEQQTGQTAGTGYAQSPAPGSPIRLGDTVTITVVKGSRRVPDVRGMSQAEGCATLENAGYSCDARADALARNAVITTQDTAPGTPMDGGTVVIHYAPYEPVALRLYQSDTGEPVYLLRRDGEPHERYNQPYGSILGYGYPHTWQQPGTVIVWDHYCTSNKDTCLGWSTNHYQSRDTKPFHDKWRGPSETARLIAPTGPDSCAAGQVRMYRFANFRGRDRDYFVGSSPPPQYDDYREFLGCLWAP